jgi:hypothetical protein
VLEESGEAQLRYPMGGTKALFRITNLLLTGGIVGAVLRTLYRAFVALALAVLRN